MNESILMVDDICVPITVSDPGCGITPLQISEVTGSGQVAKNPITDGGAGPGLYMAQKDSAPTRRNSSIGKQSWRGPHCDRHDPLLSHTKESGMNKAIILVVDDNPTNLKLATDVLSCDNYIVLKAADAEEAALIIQSSLPDLILMDIALPGMDGLTLTRKLKAAKSTRDICIVALTAFAMKGDEEKAREAGCDGYITKPIDTRALCTQVAGYLLARTNKEQDPAELTLHNGGLSN